MRKSVVNSAIPAPKGSTQLGWEEMDAPLKSGNWPVMAPSEVAWSERNQRARAMTRADMDRVREEFVVAAEMAARAGFDMLEIHCAHGYLLSSFITPLTNWRTDEYGGSLENRMRYPLEIFQAVRAVWPAEKPISVRISANDWVGAEGIEPQDAVGISRMLQEAGVDICDVSAGQTSVRARPVYGRMFQTPFSDRIRNETGMATMAVGNIYEPDHVNSILMAGRADLVCLARPHLANPYWTLHAAAKLGDRAEAWPPPYYAGRDQLYRLAGSSEPRAGRGLIMASAVTLAGKHALVTGGGTGIGAAIALALAECGAAVTICGRRLAELQVSAKRHDNIHPQTADVTDADSLQRLYHDAQAARGAFGIVIANAGVAESAPAEKVSPRIMGPHHRCQSDGCLSFGAARARGDARAQMGTHRLYCLDRGAQGLRLCRALCRRQARRDRSRPHLGDRDRESRYHRKRRLSGLR